jgi:type II secretory pathway component PulF
MSKIRNILAREINPWVGQLLWTCAFLLLVVDCWMASDDFRNALGDILQAFVIAAVLILLVLCLSRVAQFASRPRASRRAAMILEHVEQALCLNLPLAPIILASAQSEYGVVRSRLLALHECLEKGEPLATALANAVPELRGRKLRAIIAAEQIGRLPQALRRMTGQTISGERQRGDLGGIYRLYAIFLLFLFASGVGGLITIAVIPKFESILHSFGLRMPWITMAFIAISQSYIPLILVGVGLFLFLLPHQSALRDYLVWPIPVIGPTERDHGLADMCGFVADALDAGQPMETALTQAALAQPNAVLRKRITTWSNAIVAGQSLPQGARKTLCR